MAAKPRGRASVRSSNLHGWVVEVYDTTAPWGSPPVSTIPRPTRPNRREAQQIADDYFARIAELKRQLGADGPQLCRTPTPEEQEGMARDFPDYVRQVPAEARGLTRDRHVEPPESNPPPPPSNEGSPL